MLSRPIAIDLFSGCGGVSEGLRQARFHVAAAVEIDEFAAETYALNHTDTLLFKGDIRAVDPEEVRRRAVREGEQVTVLAACAPCQGFSRMRTLNQRSAVDDPRNDLVLWVLPFVEVFRPKAIMLENVPGAKLSPQMQMVRDRLQSEGYQFREAVLNVSDYGVPQNRKRYILVGARGALPCFPSKVVKQKTVRQAIAHLPHPGESGDPAHDIGVARHKKKVLDLIARIPVDGGSRSALPSDEQLRCHQRSTGFSDVYGRMAWDKPSPTITSGFVNPSKGRFLHPQQNRAITPREAALLQGFPEDYQFSMRRGKYGVAELIGNAVPPEFARRQAAAICSII